VLPNHLYELPDDQSGERVEQECSVMQDNDEKGGRLPRRNGGLS
jgi:hypothetical protein